MPCALPIRSEEHTSELQSHDNLVCRLLLEKKKKVLLHSNFSYQASRRGRIEWYMLCTTSLHFLTSYQLEMLNRDFFSFSCSFFFFKDTATTEIYTLSLHDALPISSVLVDWPGATVKAGPRASIRSRPATCDRSEEHTSELQSHDNIVCRLLLE